MSLFDYHTWLYSVSTDPIKAFGHLLCSPLDPVRYLKGQKWKYHFLCLCGVVTQETQRESCSPMGTWWQIFRAFSKWRTWVTDFNKLYCVCRYLLLTFCKFIFLTLSNCFHPLSPAESYFPQPRWLSHFLPAIGSHVWEAYWGKWTEPNYLDTGMRTFSGGFEMLGEEVNQRKDGYKHDFWGGREFVIT